MKKKLLSKKRIMLILLIVGLLIIFLNPLRRSTETIRADILEHTPIGSTSEEVMEFIEKKYRNKEIFIYKEGEPNVDVTLGKYNFILDAYVIASWRFDEEGNLERFSVKKEIYGP